MLATYKKWILAGSAVALSMMMSACTTVETGQTTTDKTKVEKSSFLLGGRSLEDRYLPEVKEPFPVASAKVANIPERFQRTVVSYPSREQPGTVIVDPSNRYLYLIAGNGQAIRYGVGVGGAGLTFKGEAVLQVKKKWPTWRPTNEMIARNPKLYKRYENYVLPGGPTNPLGARALYLFQNNADTFYRIHGTTQPSSIGQAVSSGCIRMLNADVIDLYERVKPGAKVIVL